MKRILITGAIGNTGFETIRFLFENNSSTQIMGGVRNVDRAKNKFAGFRKNLVFPVFMNG